MQGNFGMMKASERSHHLVFSNFELPHETKQKSTSLLINSPRPHPLEVVKVFNDRPFFRCQRWLEQQKAQRRFLIIFCLLKEVELPFHVDLVLCCTDHDPDNLKTQFLLSLTSSALSPLFHT